jgi:hypothetical protein
LWPGLAAGEASVSKLAEPFGVSLPAMAKHLRVLEHAEFPTGQGPAPYQMGWEGGLVKLEELLVGSPVDA